MIVSIVLGFWHFVYYYGFNISTVKHFVLCAEIIIIIIMNDNYYYYYYYALTHYTGHLKHTGVGPHLPTELTHCDTQMCLTIYCTHADQARL